MSGWHQVPDKQPERWQCDNDLGMMLGIVERALIGWRWRNTWAGPGKWTLRRQAAMDAAERGAYDAPDVYPYDPDEPDD